MGKNLTHQNATLDVIRKNQDEETNTRIRKTVLELLTEITEICTQNKILYYLNNETALYAYREGTFSPATTASICIHAKDVLKLSAALETSGIKERTLDFMMVNNRYPDFSLRYVNDHTLWYSTNGSGEFLSNGIFINIDILCVKPGKLAGKRGSLYQKLWALNQKSPEKTKGRKRKLIRSVSSIWFGLLGKSRGRILFKRLLKIYSKGSGNAYILKKKKYQRAVFEGKPAEVSINGKIFAAPPRIEDYLKKRFGQWTTYQQKQPRNVFVDPDVSCKSIEELLNQDWDALDKDTKRYEALQEEIDKDNKIIWHSYDVLSRSNDRFLMYQHYMPLKQQIVSLYDQGRYEEANELLQPYRSVLFKYYKKGMSVYFDKELFDITMDILAKEELPEEKRNGRAYYIKKLREWVPKEHLEPIVIYNYRGEIVK